MEKAEIKIETLHSRLLIYVVSLRRRSSCHCAPAALSSLGPGVRSPLFIAALRPQLLRAVSLADLSHVFALLFLLHDLQGARHRALSRPLCDLLARRTTLGSIGTHPIPNRDC
jgi:hypothetical protein